MAVGHSILASIYHMELYADSYAEASSYFPPHREFALGPEEYLDQIRPPF